MIYPFLRHNLLEQSSSRFAAAAEPTCANLHICTVACCVSIVPAGYLWSTTPQSSPLYQKHAQDIARFTRALQQLWDSQQVLLLLLTPLRLLCRVIGCGDAFWDEMVNPLGVIFFGTGQRMDACPAIILAGEGEWHLNTPAEWNGLGRLLQMQMYGRAM
jgi:hypothetical protein